MVTIKNLPEDSQPPPLVHGKGNARVDSVANSTAWSCEPLSGAAIWASSKPPRAAQAML
jgi:hypothetical protein